MVSLGKEVRRVVRGSSKALMSDMRLACRDVIKISSEVHFASILNVVNTLFSNEPIIGVTTS